MTEKNCIIRKIVDAIEVEISRFSADVEEWMEGPPGVGARPDLQTVETGLEQTGHTPKEQKESQ